MEEKEYMTDMAKMMLTSGGINVEHMYVEGDKFHAYVKPTDSHVIIRNNELVGTIDRNEIYVGYDYDYSSGEFGKAPSKYHKYQKIVFDENGDYRFLTIDTDENKTRYSQSDYNKEGVELRHSCYSRDIGNYIGLGKPLQRADSFFEVSGNISDAYLSEFQGNEVAPNSTELSAKVTVQAYRRDNEYEEYSKPVTVYIEPDHALSGAEVRAINDGCFSEFNQSFNNASKGR